MLHCNKEMHNKYITIPCALQVDFFNFVRLNKDFTKVYK